MEKILGRITVESVTDNPDGTSTIVFNIPDDVKENIKKTMGWNRWSTKKFNELVTESIMRTYKDSTEMTNEQPTRQANTNLVDPFDNNDNDTSKNNV